MTREQLLSAAEHALECAYAPYSDFCVGAALLCKSGEVFTGCNIENAAFSPTCCAERVAFYKAISEGFRNFTAIAVCAKKHGERVFVTPCGVCRQVMREFCGEDFAVHTHFGTYSLSSLLPNSFSL